MSDEGFQPFGYRFDVLSKLPPEQLKAAIRRKWRRWWDKRDGPRGWIAGPFLCLWNSAFDRLGPMVIARISPLDTGSVISGRAGSDLNGTAYALGWAIVVLSAFSYWAYRDGLSRDLMFGGGFIIGLGLILLWTKHLDRREADPLVRFLQGVEQPARAKRAKSKLSPSATGSLRPIILTIDGVEQPSPTTPSSIEVALDGLDSRGFLILASGPETYMQVAEVNEEFIIERRDGDHRSHVRAVYADGRSGHESDAGTTFSAEVTLETLLAYAAGKPLPSILTWRPL